MIKGKKMFKVIAAIMLVFVSVVSLTGCGDKKKDNGGEDKAYLEPINTYYTGIINKDVEQVNKAFPDFIKDEYTITKEDLEDYYKTYSNVYGNNIKLSYSIKDNTSLGNTEIAELKNEIKEKYTSINPDDITAAYHITVDLQIEADKKEDTEPSEQQDESSEEEKSKEENESTRTTTTEKNEHYVINYKGTWYTF